MFRKMGKRKEKADQNAVAELTREWLYKENKWLWEENRKLKEELDRVEEIKDREWIKLLNENERLSKELEKKEKSLRVWRKLKK